jgi:hypothetical protein
MPPLEAAFAISAILHRHSQNIAKHQFLSINPFEFAIQLPPSQKERVIMARIVKKVSSTPDVLE